MINGRKWWSSGVGDPRCKVAIVMGKSDPDGSRHGSQSMILLPMDAPGVTVERMLSVFGYDHAPHGHGEVVLETSALPADATCCWARGAASRSRRAASGRGASITACAPSASAEVALEMMCRRLTSRVAFGKRISDHSVWEQRVARARIDIEMSRLLCLKAADMMDSAGNKAAKNEIAMIKVQAPTMALQIIDDAIQAMAARA